MKQATKDAIYMILDLLDSVSRTAKNTPNFIKIDENTLKDVKNELLELLNQSNSAYSIKNVDKKTELIGTLPSVLASREKFPKNEDIAKLAQRSLNYEAPSWKTRGRDAIIGMIIDEIARRNEDELKDFFEKWNNFLINNENRKYINMGPGRKQFVDVWLDFFDHYQGGNK